MPSYEPIHPRFGAMVTEVNLSEPLAPEEFQDLQEAFAFYSVLVFPNQPLTQDQQISFSRRFGPPEATKVGSYGAGTPLVILSNVGEDGTVVSCDHRLNMVHKANSLWHSDSSFKRMPALASFLSAKTVPPEGGETEYASMILAWEDLPDETKFRVQDRIVTHHFAISRNQIDDCLMTRAEYDELPPVAHPMVRTIPETGKQALYIGSHSGSISDMSDKQAKSLIQELITFATTADKVYTHSWKENDAVLWDNRAVIHRGRPFARDEHPRIMIRTTVAGRRPTV